MKKYVTSDISTIIGAPLLKRTVNFLQDSWTELTNAQIIAAIGQEYDTTKAYRLYGAQLTRTTGYYYTTSAGAIFFNGEVYYVDAVGGLGAVFNLGIGLQIVTTYDSDPTIFSDGSGHNVHSIRKMQYINTATPTSPSAPFDYLNSATVEWANLNQAADISVNLMDGDVITFEKDKNIIYQVSDPSSNTLYISGAGAKQGAKVTVYVTGTPGAAVHIANYGGYAYNIVYTGERVLSLLDGSWVATFTFCGDTNNSVIVQATAQNIYEEQLSLNEWTNMTLNSGWTASPATYPQYRVDGMGRVYLRGQANLTLTMSASASIFDLPTGAKPTYNMKVPAYYANGGSVGIGYIDLTTSGLVKPNNFISGYTYSIDGITFLNS